MIVDQTECNSSLEQLKVLILLLTYFDKTGHSSVDCSLIYNNLFSYQERKVKDVEKDVVKDVEKDVVKDVEKDVEKDDIESG